MGLMRCATTGVGGRRASPRLKPPCSCAGGCRGWGGAWGVSWEGPAGGHEAQSEQKGLGAPQGKVEGEGAREAESVMIEEEGLVQLLVHANGQQEYTLRGDDTQAAAGLRSSPGRGVGLFAPPSTSTSSSSSSSAIHDSPLSCVCVGKYRSHVCFECMKVMAKGTRAKQRSDAPGINFCSSECLEMAGSAYLDLAANYLCPLISIDPLVPKGQDDRLADLKILTILACCRAMTSKTALQSLHQVLNKSFSGSDDSAGTASIELLRHAKSDGGQGKLARFLEGIGQEKLARLLSIMRFNVQSLPILQLPGTYILCLLPTLSKLNHSCLPNSGLVRDDTKVTSATGPFRVRLQPLFTTPTKQEQHCELTISYLSLTQLCGSRRERQQLLEGAFRFVCGCERCSREETREREGGSDDVAEATRTRLTSLLAKREWASEKEVLSALDFVKAELDAAAVAAASPISLSQLALACHPLLVILLKSSLQLQSKGSVVVALATSRLVRCLDLAGFAPGAYVEMLEVMARGVLSMVSAAKDPALSREEKSEGVWLVQRALLELDEWHSDDATAENFSRHLRETCSKVLSF